MGFLRQAILSLVVLGAAVALWIIYVPSAMPMLDRVGLLAPLGLSPPAPAPGAADAAGGAAGRGGTGGGRGGQAVPVVALAAGSSEIDASVSAIGDGRALHSVVVVPESSGQLTAVNFTSGNRVEAGAVLATLDDEAERIARDKAQLVLADARDKADRLTKLQSSGAASATAISDALLAVRTAELALHQAEFDLSRRRILAPISGWIGLRSAEVGDQVTPSTQLAQIDDRSSILVNFRIPERYVTMVAEKMPLTAEPLSMPGRCFQGVVRALDNRVDPASRTLLVEAELLNADDSLRAGMAFSIHMSFPGEVYPSVNPLAIQWGSDGSFVWVVRDGKAARVPVRIMQRNSDSVLVAGTLAAGELVVTEGVQLLRPGAQVAVQEAEGGAEAPPTKRASAEAGAAPVKDADAARAPAAGARPPKS